jgi:hypothetical protein
MDDQWRHQEPPRPGELMQRGGRAGRGRYQRERRNRLRIGCSLGDPLHHVGTLDANVAEQANDPISRVKPRSFTREPPHPAQTVLDGSKSLADRNSAPRQRCHRRVTDPAAAVPPTRQLSINRRPRARTCCHLPTPVSDCVCALLSAERTGRTVAMRLELRPAHPVGWAYAVADSDTPRNAQSSR